MKLYIARNIYGVINRIPLNSLKDKSLRNALISNHLSLRKLMLDFDGDTEELRKKMFEGYEDEVQKFVALQNKAQSENLSAEEAEKLYADVKPEAREVIAAYSQEYDALLNKEVSITLKPCSLEAFTELLTEIGAQYSLNDIAELNDYGLFE